MGNILLKYVFIIIVVFSWTPKSYGDFEGLQKMIQQAGQGDEWDSGVYSQYVADDLVKHEDAEKVLEKMLTEMNTWIPQVFRAYTNRGDMDFRVVGNVLRSMSQSNDVFSKGWLYMTFMEMSKEPPREQIVYVLDQLSGLTQNQGNIFDESEPIEAYEAYLQRPKIDLDLVDNIFRTVVPRLPESDQGRLYLAYLSRSDAEPTRVQASFQGLSGLSEGVQYQIYLEYMEDKAAVPAIKNELINRGLKFNDLELQGGFLHRFLKMQAVESAEKPISEEDVIQALARDDRIPFGYALRGSFEEYIRKNDAKPEIIDRILNDLRSSFYQEGLWKAYFESPQISKNTIEEFILKFFNGFLPRGHHVWFFEKYLRGEHADQEFIQAIFKGMENFNDPSKNSFFLTYLSMADLYQKKPYLFKNKVFDMLEQPQHLIAMMQDPELGPVLIQFIIDRYLLESPYNASVVWHIIEGYRGSRYTKSAA